MLRLIKLNKKYILFSLFLLCLGFSLYGSTLANGFLLDDASQIVSLKLIHHLQNTLFFFVGSLYNPNTLSFFGYYYKPLLFISYTLLYAVGHGTSIPFHVFQLLLHITNTLLFTYLLNKYFPFVVSAGVSLLFFLHPSNQETVVYIANLQDVLFVFFGLLGLILTVSFQTFSPKRVILISLFLFLSLLSKETGILFIPLVIILSMRQNNQVLKRFHIAFIGMLSSYVVLRSVASLFPFAKLRVNPFFHTTLGDRILLLPQLFFFYLKQIFIPDVFVYEQKNTPHILPPHLWIFFVIIIIGSVLMSVLFLRSLMRKRKTDLAFLFLFFAFWFLEGLFFHLQLIPLDFLVAKRWLYFPLLGFFGMWGVISTCYWQKRIVRILFFALIVTASGFFLMQTYHMNSHWRNAETLHSWNRKL